VSVLTRHDVDVGAAPEDVAAAPLERLAHQTNGTVAARRHLRRQGHRLRCPPSATSSSSSLRSFHALPSLPFPAVKFSEMVWGSGFQTGVRGPKGVRDGFPWGPREDSEK